MALPRALYSKKELLVIDDGFSELDAETKEKVLTKLFGNSGLLRRTGLTVIVVTHAVHHLQFADQILAFDSNGHMIEQGTFSELKAGGGYVVRLLRHVGERALGEERTDTTENSEDEKKLVSRVVDQEAIDDRLAMQNTELSTYKYYFESIGWQRSFFSLCIFLVACVSVSTKVTQLVIQYWTSAVSAHGNTVNPLYLGIYGVFAGIGILVWPAALFHYFMNVVLGSSEELHVRLLKSVMGALLSIFAATDTGMTANR